MRKLYTLCLLSLSLGLSVSAQTATVPVLKNGSTSVYTMSCDNVTLEVDAAFGGRITSLVVTDPAKSTSRELLNQSTDMNQKGSTFWPSPQAPWNWPPLPIIDTSAYTVRIDSKAIILTSKLETKNSYNLRITKRIHFNPADTSIVIKYTIKNEGTTNQSWAPWEVSRVPASGLTIFKKESGDFFTTGSNPLLYNSSRIPLYKDFYWYNQSLESNKVTSSSGEKLMCDGLGWLAHCPADKDRIFIKRFDNIPVGSIAPNESELQIYTGSNNSYTELENQGAYTSIAPNDSISYTVRWYAKVLPFSGSNVSMGSAKLINYLNAVLARGDQYAGIKNQTAKTTDVIVNASQHVMTVQTNLTSYSNVNIVVYDLQGRVALKQAILDPQQEVSVKGLAAGSYLYQINKGSSSISKGKFLINR